MVVPGEYTELESEPKIRHIHCIGPTMIGVFDTGLEAIKAFEAYDDTVIIHSTGPNGEKSQSKVDKSDIEVMSENEYMERM